MMCFKSLWIAGVTVTVALGLGVAIAAAPSSSSAASMPYLGLSAPQKILDDPQHWEGDQQPHTLSVIELNRDGYKYWAWYGLNQGRGMGLARSNDLVHWTKYSDNPIWLNARWPSALEISESPGHAVLYFAITRDYDTPSSHIVLAKSTDGIHLEQVGVLVKTVNGQRNQNPNLFHDPRSGKFFLTFYRGNDHDDFKLVSKSARTIEGLAHAPEKLLMHMSTTVAAPTLLYVPNAGPESRGVYYLATEIYPGRYSKGGAGWQVKVFYSDRPDGQFRPVTDNPVQSGDRACMFQFIFDGKFYGYQSHLDTKTDKWEMEVVTAALPGNH